MMKLKLKLKLEEPIGTLALSAPITHGARKCQLSARGARVLSAHIPPGGYGVGIFRFPCRLWPMGASHQHLFCDKAALT